MGGSFAVLFFLGVIGFFCIIPLVALSAAAATANMGGKEAGHVLIFLF